ncbi:hypothetical protein AB0887_32215, partial [Streptomyces huasconensis]
LVFRRSSRNFNPLAAMAGRVTVAEVEELVEPLTPRHPPYHGARHAAHGPPTGLRPEQQQGEGGGG